MRRFLLAFSLVFLILLTGCAIDPGTYYFNEDVLVNETKKVELVLCKNESPKMIEISEDSFPSFNYEDSKLLETLDEELIESLIGELATITFHIEYKSANAPVGNTLLLHQKNNDIIVISGTLINGISYSVVARFDYKGKFLEHISYFADRRKYEDMLKKYFESVN